MCGVIGAVGIKNTPDLVVVNAMRDRLTHRGPDDADTWFEGNVALAHTRLSIIDLSSGGRQPMISTSGRYVIVYNGEVYNFEELRSELPDVSWRGRSDTEVILEAIARWGVERALGRFVGMFSLGVYDRKTGDLWLARDRLGIKPLYFGWIRGAFVFASELSAIEVVSDHGLAVSRDALSLYLRHNYVPTPYSIYSGIRKLEPGTFVCLTQAMIESKRWPSAVRYWSLEGIAQSTQVADADVEHELLRRLREAVRCRLVADVPLGVFLSGGVDSSMVCALMQEASSDPVRSFSVGFEQDEYNEAEHAKRVAHHLGCTHTELYVSHRDLLDAVAEIPRLVGEPFADSSLIPTYLISKLARRHVTVALSGDGGDELFWGYTRYPAWQRLTRSIAWVPRSLRRGAVRALTSGLVQAMTNQISSPRALGRRRPLSSKLTALAGLLEFESTDDLYLRLISHWKSPDDVVIDGREPPTVYTSPDHWANSLPPWRRVSTKDLLAYLPDDILTKVDRASMGVSLEARVPLLDHRVVEFCHSLPERYIRRGATSKWLLKKILEQYVPRTLTDRPKQGFGVPIGEWLRGPLREWMSDLLSPTALTADGFFDPLKVQAIKDAHLDGSADWGPYLWDIVVFQAWARQRGESMTASVRSTN